MMASARWRRCARQCSLSEVEMMLSNMPSNTTTATSNSCVNSNSHSSNTNNNNSNSSNTNNSNNTNDSINTNTTRMLQSTPPKLASFLVCTREIRSESAGSYYSSY